MPDQRIDQLNPLITADVADEIAVWDNDVADTVRLSFTNFLKYIAGLPENTIPTGDDLLSVIDDPAGLATPQRLTLSNFLKVVNTLAANTTPAVADEILLMDDVGGTLTAQKISLTNFFKAINGLAANTTPAGADELVLMDDVGGTLAAQKITLANLLGKLPTGFIIGTNAGPLNITPASASSLNVNLATTGDLVVNTTQLVVDTSAAAVGIGTAGPAASALLDLTSTAKGLLPPRMTTAQRNGIGSPIAGLVVFNSDTAALNIHDGTGWRAYSYTHGVAVTLGDGTNVITAGMYVDVPDIPYAATIVRVRVIANASGNLVIDVRKADWATVPTYSTITAAATPTLTGAQKLEDTTLTGWTTGITAGDSLRFIVTGVPATITQASIQLRYIRTS